MSAVISLRGIVKRYASLSGEHEALSVGQLDIHKADYWAVTGPSGSGKSTLLGVLGLLVLPTVGQVLVDGVTVAGMSDAQRSRLRSRMFGFVFQSAELVPGLTVLENVLLPAELSGRKGEEPRARDLLERVGMSHRMRSFPAQLSGGEACRVALARAAINRPLVVLADEPTGDLDAANGERALEILEEMRRDGSALILATHDEAVARRAANRLRIRDGRIES
jgi:ABC-type lipoprotein export system ATPase subunit